MKKQLVTALTCHTHSVRCPPSIPCTGSCDSCSIDFGFVLLLFGEAVHGIHGFKEYTPVSSSSDENTEKYYKRVLCFIYLADRRVCSKSLRTLKNKEGASVCRVSTLCYRNADLEPRMQSADPETNFTLLMSLLHI